MNVVSYLSSSLCWWYHPSEIRHTNTHTNTHTHARTHARTRTHTRTRTRTRTHTHTHTHTHAHAHAHAHTHRNKSNMAGPEWQEIPVKLSFSRDVRERGASWWCADTRRTLFVRLVKLLETIAGRSRTTNTWTYNLVKTVIIIMNFSHEGREGNWVVHLLDAGATLPYFHSAGCHNYTRFAAFYVHHMI